VLNGGQRVELGGGLGRLVGRLRGGAKHPSLYRGGGGIRREKTETSLWWGKLEIPVCVRGKGVTRIQGLSGGSWNGFRGYSVIRQENCAQWRGYLGGCRELLGEACTKQPVLKTMFILNSKVRHARKKRR